MYELKTKVNDESVMAFIEQIENEKRKNDCKRVVDIMIEITNEKPKMWGDSIIGFGLYKYTYQSGHSGEWFIVGLSPRKQNLTIYLMNGFSDSNQLLEKLGKYKTGKSCLYINKLENINIDVLKQLIKNTYEEMKK